MKEFIVDSISRETLEQYGYDSSQVSDEIMRKIADTLRFTFRECVLDNLPQIADDYKIPISTNPYFSVNRVYVSLNNEDGNSHETKLFKSKEDALAQLKQWRADELDLRKESATAYEILADQKDSFRMAWDNERELLSIGVS